MLIALKRIGVTFTSSDDPALRERRVVGLTYDNQMVGRGTPRTSSASLSSQLILISSRREHPSYRPIGRNFRNAGRLGGRMIDTKVEPTAIRPIPGFRAFFGTVRSWELAPSGRQ